MILEDGLIRYKVQSSTGASVRYLYRQAVGPVAGLQGCVSKSDLRSQSRALYLYPSTA